MGWGRPSPTRCRYILVRSPPASMPPDGRRNPPQPMPRRRPLRKAPRMCEVSPAPQTKGRAQRHEPGRGFSGRLEARMPEASLQGRTCGVPLNPLPGSCPALYMHGTPAKSSTRIQSFDAFRERANRVVGTFVQCRCGVFDFVGVGLGLFAPRVCLQVSPCLLHPWIGPVGAFTLFPVAGDPGGRP